MRACLHHALPQPLLLRRARVQVGELCRGRGVGVSPGALRRAASLCLHERELCVQNRLLRRHHALLSFLQVPNSVSL